MEDSHGAVDEVLDGGDEQAVRDVLQVAGGVGQVEGLLEVVLSEEELHDVVLEIGDERLTVER